jgi:four helix bundle protein
VKKGREGYGKDSAGPRLLFHHEALDVYKVSLQAFSLLTSITEIEQIPVAQFRRLDILATSIVLNIAEGNSRFSVLEQSRFLNSSYEAAVKLAARLDICSLQGMLPMDKVEQLKELLLRISSMMLVMLKKTQP